MFKNSAFMAMQADAYAPAEFYCASFTQIVAVAVKAIAFFIIIPLIRVIRLRLDGLYVG